MSDIFSDFQILCSIFLSSLGLSPSSSVQNWVGFAIPNTSLLTTLFLSSKILIVISAINLSDLYVIISMSDIWIRGFLELKTYAFNLKQKATD